MQDVHTPVPTSLPVRPDTGRGRKEAPQTPSRINVASADAQAKWDAVMDDELAALFADLAAMEEKKETATTLDDISTPEEVEEHAKRPRDEASLKRPTFEPSTRIEGGKARWGRTRFVGIPHAVLTHEGFSEVSGRALKLLFALQSQFVGSNNGHLTATARRMRKFGFRSKDSLAKSIQELIDFGYMVRTRSQERRLPALYAITWLPINKAPKGQPYDAGITHSDEASDLWRHTDPLKAKCKVVARRAAETFRKLGDREHEVAPSHDAAPAKGVLH